MPLRRLGDLVDLVGEAVNPSSTPSEQFAHYSIPAFDAGLGPALEAGSAILSNKVLIKPGVVLFSKLNPRISRVWHVTEDTPHRRICSTEFLPLAPHPSELLPKYLSYALREPGLISRLRAQVAAATKSRERLDPEIVLGASIPTPSIAVQHRIAARLTGQLAAVERARKAAQARLEAALQVGRAQLRTLFGSPEARAWTRKRLEGVAEIVGGVQKSPARAPVTNHRPFLTVRNVQRGYLDLSVVEHFEVTPREVERLRLRAGDILVVEGNGSLDHIGRNALFVDDGQEWVHQNHVIRVRLDQRVCVPQFVSRFLNSDQGWEQMVEKARTTSGLFTLSAGKVALLEIPVPSLPVQEQAISTLNAAAGSGGAALSALRDELTTVEALPAALLRGVFGQVDY